MACIAPLSFSSLVCVRCIVSSNGIDGSIPACMHWMLLAASSSAAVLLAEGDAPAAFIAAAAASFDVPIIIHG